MKVWTRLSENDLYDIAEEIGVALSDRGTVYNYRMPITKVGRAYSFGLRPTSYKNPCTGDHKYQRVSASVFQNERRVFAVCWHGHRDFMLALFDRDPDARIKSAMADYKGALDFLDKYPDTAYGNVGSQMYPQYASDVCKC